MSKMKNYMMNIEEFCDGYFYGEGIMIDFSIEEISEDAKKYFGTSMAKDHAIAYLTKTLGEIQGIVNPSRFICRALPVVIMGSFLSGCGIMPMWTSVVQAVTDAALSVTTGKSSSEHGLSTLTGKDCQFIRIIDEQNVCMSSEEYEKYLFSLNCETYTWSILNRVSCKKEQPPQTERLLIELPCIIVYKNFVITEINC